MKAFGFKSKSEAVNMALAELLKKKRRELVEMFGKAEYYPDYDYKKLPRVGDERPLVGEGRYIACARGRLHE